jgi:chaperonin GroES
VTLSEPEVKTADATPADATPPDARPVAATSAAPKGAKAVTGPVAGAERLPIRMLHDRVLVDVEGEAGERRSSSGIVIPATAAVGKRLAWATVVAVGHNVRQVQLGDRVLYDPEDRAEVELGGTGYVLLRERDIHAVAAPRVEDGQTGLYL